MQNAVVSAILSGVAKDWCTKGQCTLQQALARVAHVRKLCNFTQTNLVFPQTNFNRDGDRSRRLIRIVQ